MGDKTLMEVSGLIVAASEKLSLEQSVGLLLMLYNDKMDMFFCILVCDKVMTVWKTIHVNQNYKFTDLKIGMLQTSSGGKIFLLKTTDTSAFSDTDRLGVKKFHIEERLRSLISISRIERSVAGSSCLESNLVSYKGVLTKLKNSELGIYELDSKVLLYTTFDVCRKRLSLGSEVIISNAHLIKDHVGSPILVCCGLSCVKNSKPYDVDDEPPSALIDKYFVSFCIQYGLSIFDVFWLENLRSRLQKKLFSLIVSEEDLYKLDSNFLKNILEFFLCEESGTAGKKFSVVEEFLSSPHQCFPFSQSRLPTGCRVPYLTEISDEVVRNASWIEASPRWKFCVGSLDDSVIIGILYISNNGRFYIGDRTSKLPIILSEDCDACCHDQNIIPRVKSSKCAFVVAVQEYDVIVENISCKNGIQQSIRYLRTSFCRLYTLLTLRKSSESDSFTTQSEKEEENVNTSQIYQDVENVTDFHNTSLEKKHRFLVLSKIWTFENKVPSSSCVLVLLLPENTQRITENSITNESLLDDTFNFYNSGDDAEFANLISKLDFLRIGEGDSRIGYLRFDAATVDSVVFPGHIYAATPKDKTADISFDFEDHSNGLFTWTARQDIEIIHDPSCMGNHCIEEHDAAECHGIKEILSKRQLSRNWIVNCILQDKTYEDVENSSEVKSSATLCMSVRDCDSEESSVKVYVPRFSGSLCGLLPGAALQLFGFLCFHSQGGNLYLKASPTFGIHVRQTKTLAGKCRYENSCKVEGGNAFLRPLQSLCFVLRITHAEVFSACSGCGRPAPKRCPCYSQYRVRLKLSALIDDGSRLLLAHCQDGTARKILDIDSREWQALASHVQVSQQCLKFSEKAFWSKSALSPLMNQVFNTYCSSRATSRRLMLEYISVPRPYSTPADLPSVWCRNAESLDCQKHTKGLYLKLTEMNSSPSR